MSTVGVDVLVRLIDRLTAPLRNTEEIVKKASERMQSRLQLSANFALAADGAARFSGKINGALGAVVSKAVSFESAMADVRKVVEFQEPDGLVKFGRHLREMSREIPLTAEGLASIAAAGGQLGIAADKLPDFVETVAKMSTAFDMMPEQAGEAMAMLSNVYQLPIKDIGKLGDAINHLSDGTAAKASGIVETLGRIGGTAKQFGLAADEAAALSDAFLALGKPPEVAGTAINAMLMKMQTATKQNDKFGEGLAAIGVDARDLEKAIGQDAQGALIGFLEKLEAVDQQSRAGILSDLFGMEYADDISLLTGSLDEYRKALGLVGDEADYAGSMQREFANRAATTANGFTLLQNRVDDFQSSLGEALLPAIKDLTDRLGGVIDKMVKWVQANPELTKTIVTVVAVLGAAAAVMAPVLLGLSALTSAWAIAAYAGTRFGLGAIKFGQALLWVGRVAAPVVLRAVVSISRALIANPIGVVIMAIAGAAYLLYRYWGPISAFFKKLWADISGAFKSGVAWISGAVSSLVNFDWAGLFTLDGLAAAWQSVKTALGQYLSTLWDALSPLSWLGLVKAEDLAATWATVTGFLADAGGRLWAAVTSIDWAGLINLDGIKAAWGSVTEWFSQAAAKIWDLVPEMPEWDFKLWGDDEIESPETLLAAARAAQDLEAQFPVLSAAADQTVLIVSAAILAMAGQFAAVDFAADGARLIAGLADGMLSQVALVTAAATAITAAIRSAIPANVGVNIGVTGSRGGAGVQARAGGGSFGAGWLLTGEQGPELEYRSKGGYIAHHAALRGMLSMATQTAALLKGGDGGAVIPSLAEVATAAPGTGKSITHAPRYTVSIDAGGAVSPQEVAAIVRREMIAAERRAAADMRGVLRDD